MGLLDTFGLSSSSADARARTALKAGKKATAKQKRATTKGYREAKGAVTEGYGTARQDLAPALEAAGRYLTGQQEGYDVYRGALGLTGDQGAADAEAAYRRSLQPGYNQGVETINRQRVGGGNLNSGGTSTDLMDYTFNSYYDPWRQSLQGFNPLAANQQLAGIGTTLGGYATGQGNALSGLATGQASNLSNIYGTQGANKQNYYDTLNTNAANVAGNWGSLAKGVLEAGVGLAGGPAGAFAAKTLFGPAGTGRITGNIGNNPNWDVS